MKKSIVIIPVLLALFSLAQYEHEVTGYIWPEDEQVLKKLDEWQDLKFGLLMHREAYPPCEIAWAFKISAIR